MEEGPQHDVSDGRKAAYYIGNIVTVVGVLVFLSVFITGAMHFGDFSDFQGQVQSSMFRAIGGMVLIVVGQVVARIGRSGLAGSGVVLDPRKSRKDLEPWNRAAGGLVNDALEEMPALKNLIPGEKSAGQVVKVRCGECGTLNDEDSKYCKGCGKAL